MSRDQPETEVLVTMGDEMWRTTLREFISDNADYAGIEEVRASLAAGKSVRFGGGAAPPATVKPVEKDEAFGCEKCGCVCVDFLCLDCSPLATCPVCRESKQLEFDAYGIAVCSRSCRDSLERDLEDAKHEGQDGRQFE